MCGLWTVCFESHKSRGVMKFCGYMGFTVPVYRVFRTIRLTVKNPTEFSSIKKWWMTQRLTVFAESHRVHFLL